MTELRIIFPGCFACGLRCDAAYGSAAEHPDRGPAIVTCFHGPVHLRSLCKCGNTPSLLSSDGEVLGVLDPIEARDVAWLILPSTSATARELSTERPAPGDSVTAVLPMGAEAARIQDIVGRHGSGTTPLELQLDRLFAQGQSGSPILDAKGRVLAVVRDTGGRCALVSERLATPL